MLSDKGKAVVTRNMELREHITESSESQELRVYTQTLHVRSDGYFKFEMCKESVASVGNVELDSFTVDKDDYIDDTLGEDAVRRVAVITLNSREDWQQQLIRALSEVYSVGIPLSSENTYPIGVWIKPVSSTV